MQQSLIQKVIFNKEQKNICCMKVDGSVDHRTVTKGSRNFTEVARTSMIKQDLVSLKLFILRLCSKP